MGFGVRRRAWVRAKAKDGVRRLALVRVRVGRRAWVRP